MIFAPSRRASSDEDGTDGQLSFGNSGSDGRSDLCPSHCPRAEAGGSFTVVALTLLFWGFSFPIPLLVAAPCFPGCASQRSRAHRHTRALGFVTIIRHCAWASRAGIWFGTSHTSDKLREGAAACDQCFFPFVPWRSIGDPFRPRDGSDQGWMDVMDAIAAIIIIIIIVTKPPCRTSILSPCRTCSPNIDGFGAAPGTSCQNQNTPGVCRGLPGSLHRRPPALGLFLHAVFDSRDITNHGLPTSRMGWEPH